MLGWLLGMVLQAPPPEESYPRFEPGVQGRFRFEFRDPVGYATAAQRSEDDDLYFTRLRVNLKLLAYEQVSFFVQPQDARLLGSEFPVSSREEDTGLHQGYIEVRKPGGAPVSFKIGRQELSYGDQRLVSPLDWHQIGRTWDGVSLRLEPGFGWIDLVATRTEAPGKLEDHQEFYGVYGSFREVEAHEFDLYALGRNSEGRVFRDELGRRGDLDDVTVGARAKGTSGAWDYTGELAGQWGDFVKGDASAWAVAATGGHTFEADWKPRLGAEVTFASGDDDPTDGDRGTFDPVYTFGHFYQGYADLFAWKNGIDAALRASVKPAEGLTVALHVHNFRLAEERDAWYRANGAAVRRDRTGSSDPTVGSEVDLHARTDIGAHVKLWGGWSHFWTGDYVADTGGGADLDWFFLQMTVEF